MIYISDIIHQSGKDPAHPAWDTMLVLRNTHTLPATAIIQIYNEDGTALAPLTAVLQPESTWPISFIPGNGFDNPPQDFKGHATISCTSQTPFGLQDVSVMVKSYVLIARNSWQYGVQVPCYPQPGQSGPSGIWRFPYAIPHFDDAAGATSSVWNTGVSIQNFSNVAQPCRLTYTIGQTYAQAGDTFYSNFTVPANGGVRFDLMFGNVDQHVPGLLTVGYPPTLNSEGFLDISGNSILPSLIIANASYSFMVEEAPF